MGYTTAETLGGGPKSNLATCCPHKEPRCLLPAWLLLLPEPGTTYVREVPHQPSLAVPTLNAGARALGQRFGKPWRPLGRVPPSVPANGLAVAPWASGRGRQAPLARAGNRGQAGLPASGRPGGVPARRSGLSWSQWGMSRQHY